MPQEEISIATKARDWLLLALRGTDGDSIKVYRVGEGSGASQPEDGLKPPVQRTGPVPLSGVGAGCRKATLRILAPWF